QPLQVFDERLNILEEGGFVPNRHRRFAPPRLSCSVVRPAATTLSSASALTSSRGYGCGIVRKEDQRANFDALTSLRMGLHRGKIECTVRGKSRAAVSSRVETFEQQHLARGHCGEIVPAMVGVE